MSRTGLLKFVAKPYLQLISTFSNNQMNPNEVVQFRVSNPFKYIYFYFPFPSGTIHAHDHAAVLPLLCHQEAAR
jgi:hypothetical protein